MGGNAAHPLRLQVRPGDVNGQGTISSAESKIAPPKVPGFTAAGPVQDISVRASLAHPLTLSFAAGSPDVVPVVYRRDPELGWSPVALADRGGTASAVRSAFSPHLPGMITPPRWLNDVTNSAKNWATGRTTKPACSSVAPKWADLTEPSLDVLLACASTNPDAGVDRVEVMIKNNRGLVQEIAVPPGAAYAAVQDQPDSVRKFVRSISGGRDVVLLPPGNWMSIGFARPPADQAVQITPHATPMALLVEALIQLGDLADETAAGGGAGGGVVASAAIVHACFSPGSDTLEGALDPSLGGVTKLLTQAARCLAEAAADPKKAVTIAQNVVAAQTGRPLSIVQADTAFNSRVQWWTGKINVAGVVAKAFKVVELGKLAYVIWEANGEELGKLYADADPSVLRLNLTGSANTTKRRMAPVDSRGQLIAKFDVKDLPGDTSCMGASEVSGDGHTYRCFNNHGVYDPCWAVAGNGHTIVCMDSPWSTSVERMQSTTNLSWPSKSVPSVEWGLGLKGDRQCIALQGAHSAYRNRVIDYYCDDETTVLRGFDDSTSVWKATTLTSTSGGRSSTDQVPIVSAWYADSRQPFTSPQNAISDTAIKRALQDFGNAWIAHETSTMRRYVEADTMNRLDGWSDPIRAQINWRSACRLDGSGNGECGLSMIVPEGGGFTYVVHYEAALGGTIRIAYLETLGGGA